MERKSVADCLHFINTFRLSDIGKFACIGKLEDVRDYVLSEYKNKYNKDIVALNKMFSQITIIIDKCYFDREDDMKNEYQDLTKCILGWLRVTNTEPEVENGNANDEE